MHLSKSAVRQVPVYRLNKTILKETTRANLRALLSASEVIAYTVMPEAEYKEDLFALTKEGKAMSGDMAADARSAPTIFPGETVIFDPEVEPAADKIVLARDGDSILIRRMRVVTETAEGKPELVALVPSNREFSVQVVPENHVLAVGVGIYRKI
jgi:hypothetical protein